MIKENFDDKLMEVCIFLLGFSEVDLNENIMKFLLNGLFAFLNPDRVD